jgi:hypothetical protein
VRRTTWIAITATAAIAGAAPATARADGCAADARHSYASVELFRDSNCTGASVSVGFTGDRDRPDFAAFTNYEGNVYDIDNSRDSIAVAPATCVRLFDGRGYTGLASGLLCAPASADGLFADLGALVNRASSMRVCPASTPAGCDAVLPPPVPPPVPNGAPSSPDARLVAGLKGARTRQTVRFGRGGRVRVGLTDPAGGPIAGAALQVLTREVSAAAEWQLASPLTTDATGRAELRLPAGPSRVVRVEYRALVGDAQPAATAQVRFLVRAGLALKVRPRRVRAGHRIRLTGRLLAPPATRLGKLVTFQARERGRWRDFRSARSRRGGKFTARYRFSAGARGSFPIRAVARADASYPYATGRSRAIRVRVR